MLGMVQKMFFGPLSNPKNKHLPDLNRREILAVAPLVAMIFVIGLFPGIFLDRMKDTVQLTYRQFKDASDQAIRFGDEHAAKRLDNDLFSPAFLKGAPDQKPAESPPVAALR